MYRHLLPLLVLLSYSLISLASDEIRRPLDLPSGGAGATDFEEDEPETIEFYGGSYEGDATMFVIDISGSMYGGDRIDTAKDELTSAIGSLSKDAEFGVLAFDHTLMPLAPFMFKATPANKTNAIAWVAELTPNGATCIDIAVVEGLNILRTARTNASSRQLVLLGDGGHACDGQNGPEIDEQVLADIKLQNWERVRINTILMVPLNPLSAQPALLLFSEIAAQNGGTFRAIQ